ncbi:MAG: OprD family outer membrane porin [Pyrinomonadaceae bacterium]
MAYRIDIKLAACTLSILSAYSIAACANEQSEANGFLDDSHLSAVLRNYFWHQTGDLGHQRDWEQGMMLNFQSGFTQGLVGVGADAFIYANATLDSGSGRTGGPNLQVDSDGNPTDGYAKGGGSVKLRLSNTVVRAGDLEPVVPVFAVSSYYLLNQTANGVMFDSKEIQDLTLQGGHFTSGTGLLTTARSGELGLAYAGVNTSAIDYLGGVFALSKNFSVSAYASRYEDLMNQYYLNGNYILTFDDKNSLATDFNLYRSIDSGQANAGAINVTAASLSLAYTTGAHTLTLAHVRVMGDQPFDYAAIGGTAPGVAIGKYSGGIYLANSTEISDFNGPNERSWQLKYEVNMENYGVPGLSLVAKHIYGSNIDGTHVNSDSAYYGFYGKNDKEEETDLSAKYIVQSGTFQKLALTFVTSKHTGNQSTAGDNTLARLVVDYPISFF